VNLEALVAPLRADVVSGAAVVSRAAAAAMRRGAVRLPAQDSQELLGALSQLAVRVMEAQPAMAPLVQLLSAVLTSVNPAASLDDARRAAAEAAEGFRASLEERSARVAARLADEIAPGSTVLTISSSSTVRSGLVEALERNIRVICLEGRPMNEGQGLARTLAHAGIPVVLAVDAAGEALVPEADLVLLGADSVGDRGIVNKIGSLSLARAAHAYGIPVWIAADQSKWLPPGFPQFHADDRPPDEVWKGTRGVRVWNRYFERLPFELVRQVVTDAGIFTPDELRARRQDLQAAPVLAEWAASRDPETND
jgi:translation initiation factor 2B subunit (eIF-2B alpha/beta/delta family)